MDDFEQRASPDVFKGRSGYHFSRGLIQLLESGHMDEVFAILRATGVIVPAKTHNHISKNNSVRETSLIDEGDRIVPLDQTQ